MAASMKRPSVSLTLPIACQICLGKVKEPVVCGNHHVFCNSCMEVWLQHRPHCPTCRIPITTESPCKQILGGLNTNDEDSDKRRSTPELRKTRFEMLYREQELEFEHLTAEIVKLRKKNARLEEQLKKKTSDTSDSAPSTSTSNSENGGKGGVSSRDGNSRGEENAIQTLELIEKLRTTTDAYKKIKAEHGKIKQENDQLRNTTAGYLRDICRLKQELTTRSPRKYEKYALAAQQSKLEKSEQEVKQLKRALERSDVYVEEMEEKLERYRTHFGEIPWSPTESVLSAHDNEVGKSPPETKRDGGAITRQKLEEAGINSDCKRDKDSAIGSRQFSDGLAAKLVDLCSDGQSHDDKNTGSSSASLDGEPAAKRFYASERRNAIEPDLALSTQSLGPLSLPDGMPSRQPLTSDCGPLTDPSQIPSTSGTSSATPSTLFKTLKLEGSQDPSKTPEYGCSASGTQEHKMSPVFTLQDHAFSSGSEVSSRQLPARRSPRRQLEFLAQESNMDKEGMYPPAGGHAIKTSPDKSSARDAIVGRDNSYGNKSNPSRDQYLSHVTGQHNKADVVERSTLESLRFYHQGKDLPTSSQGVQRRGEDTPNETLSELDFSLTPEFVDCAKLLKAAEQRIKERSGNGSNGEDV